ncbi:SAM-dependent methyltransferase [Streptomyces sp. enrichment culture]|uniref:SAM-dependent methyltransferase n=1 Tax=Streptomyces sp. enrichment culture TaxID=1795815 RepID=UPI003F564705
MTSLPGDGPGGSGPVGHPHTDVEYYRAWTDSRPVISCALWEAEPGEADAGTAAGPGGSAGNGDLEHAQDRKLRTMARLAGVRPGMDVLDIGCGAGAMLDHLVQACGARSAHGIELCESFCREVRRRNTPGVTVDCLDYADYRPRHRFDAVVSISMIEFLSGAWEPGRETEGQALRDFFRRTREWTRPGAGLALEVVIQGPRGLDEETSRAGSDALAKMGESPGAPPALPHLLAAADGLWEPRSVRTHRQDWLRTLSVWEARALAAQETITARWGADVMRDTLRLVRLEQESYRTGQLSMALLSFLRVGEEEPVPESGS